MLNKIFMIISMLILCSCGGGGGGGNNSIIYRFTAPSIDAQNDYSVSTFDTMNNTTNLSFIDKITSVNSDGSYSLLTYDPYNNIIFSGLVDHSIYATTFTANNSGQILTSSFTPTGSSVQNCTYSPHNGNIPSPLSLGQTWSFDFTRVCNGVSISYAVNGAFLTNENIQIPLGDFSAYKFQYTVVGIFPSGINTTDVVTVWTDASKKVPLYLKKTVDRTYSGGTPEPGSLKNQTIILENYQ